MEVGVPEGSGMHLSVGGGLERAEGVDEKEDSLIFEGVPAGCRGGALALSRRPIISIGRLSASAGRVRSAQPPRRAFGIQLFHTLHSSRSHQHHFFIILDDNAHPDYYAILSTSPSASALEIKRAYHQSLLRSHPDKRPISSLSDPMHSVGETADIGLLKRAYEVLSSPALREAYDAVWKCASESGRRHGPRPAQVVSLEEFDEIDDEGRWTYACRCGGVYAITEKDMESGQHLIGCNSCSEVVWAGYELANEAENGMDTPV
ncbi:uncharacterized protein FIBRA_00616 [Fibroporia radiculosa]|uniref:Diphthamide biosynthesis protein 4 n=1 Tax=Fibroporia radiculosa TaxID=599839 RepID=J4H0C4_9APHY|nr:uncharacterized protein FIBRA_00616 [Fibroporia radiculosa]CCL98614.1 predicted protein [Fibroporia radiculosa]